MKEYKQRFHAYVSDFYTGVGDDDENIKLKEVHSLRVYENMSELAKHLELSPGQLKIAEIIGLFHDIGRFEQLRRYRTFNDKQSINHAELGVEVLTQQKLLHELDPVEKEYVRIAILNHNKHKLPELHPDHQLYVKMIRDADKLDIYRVVTKHYEEGNGNETVTLHLPDIPRVTPTVFKKIIEGQTIAYEEMQTVADCKVMQIGWLFDFNFDYFRRKVVRLGYIDTIFRTLPSGERTDRLRERVSKYIKAFQNS